MSGTFDFSSWNAVGDEEAEEERQVRASKESFVDRDVLRAAVAELDRKKQQKTAREARAAANLAEAAKRGRRAGAGAGRAPGPHDAFVRSVLDGEPRKKPLGRRKPGAPTGAAALAAAEKALAAGQTAFALGDARGAFWRYTEGVDAVKHEAAARPVSEVLAALYASRSEAAIHTGFFQSAARDAASALAEAPDRVECWHRLATAADAEGSVDVALEACLRGLALDPDHGALRALEVECATAQRKALADGPADAAPIAAANAAVSEAAISAPPAPPATSAPPAPPRRAPPAPLVVPGDVERSWDAYVAALSKQAADDDGEAAPPPPFLAAPTPVSARA